MQVPKKQPTHKRSAGFVRIASRAKALGIPGVGSGMAPSPMGTYCSAGSGVQGDNACSNAASTFTSTRQSLLLFGTPDIPY